MHSRISYAVLGMTMISAQLHAAPTYANDRKTILALRAENNRAIAAHDLDGTMRIVADDYVMIGGSSGIERTPAENRKGWEEDFATKGHDRYVRTTTRVEIGERKGVDLAADLFPAPMMAVIGSVADEPQRRDWGGKRTSAATIPFPLRL